MMKADMRGISRNDDAETCSIASCTMHTRQGVVMIYALKIFPFSFSLSFCIRQGLVMVL
jgi:hypothetical protein